MWALLSGEALAQNICNLSKYGDLQNLIVQTECNEE
jgi:hypothetical protein